jgi:outer membrane protein TolC
MRFDQRFCARAVVTAGLVATIVSGFGLTPVHAQTTATTPPAQGPVRRMSIDDAVATAIEQNLDLQVDRFNPMIQDANSAQFEAAYTPTFTSTFALVDQTQPPSSFLSGNTNQITNGRSTFDFGIQQQTPWYPADAAQFQD